jgi:hypothetical protein
MRHWKWAAGVVVALGFAAPSFAQTNTASFGGISPLALRNEPVPTGSASIVPIAKPQFFNHTFSLANFLPNLSSMSANPVIGVSQYPSSYQPDLSWFAPFQMRRLAPLNIPY